jgi:HPt (histidine-containing phosphotransfer) domain-containing protein
MTRDDPTLPILDRAVLEELDALGRDLGRDARGEVIDLFTTTTPARAAQLAGQLASDDLAGFARLAHALRSSAAALGARRLAEVLERAERSARAQNRAEAEAALADLQRALPETLAALEALPPASAR